MNHNILSLKKLLKVSFMAVIVLSNVSMGYSQRKMETLNRGLVAVKNGSGVFLSWRIPGYEWYDVTYNVYRDGTKLNEEPLTVSNFVDDSGTETNLYTVSAIIDGVEQVQSQAAEVWSKQYFEISMVNRPSTYEINDATSADLDGDGEYEIIVKRMCQDWSAEATLFTYFEAYKLDGTLMWSINVGPNIMSSSGVEINIASFDLDEDGKAEVFMRTSEGTIFGDGTQIGDVDGDGKTNYRYSVVQSPNMQYMNEGPEFLSLIDGETGAELDRVDYIPRINAEWWGDGYGHRANKFFFGAPYLDGKHPSIFIGRGIYTKTIFRTYDVVNKKLVQRWEFRATDSSNPYFGQGNHNYTIADVDMDGRDEIVWGGMTVDDDGSGLYSTALGHGDALHVGDLDPFRKGIEIWRCLENSPVYGTVMYDGSDGEVLVHDVLGRDCGRCMAANISNSVMGATMWGSTTMYSATTKKPVNVQGNSVNFRIYWDGDLLEELLDHNWNGAGGEGVIQKSGYGTIFTASGTNSCNWTKGTPTLQADLFGDWREEVIWRTVDDSKIRIYTTVDPTVYRNYTLMHDHQYRQGICWQMCGYNQPPHVSYFLGNAEGITTPPPPALSNNRLVYTTGGVWDKTAEAWNKDGIDMAYTDNEHVLLDVSAGNDVSISVNETVSPSYLTVNSPGNYTLNTSGGKLSGDMSLIKQGTGFVEINGTHDFNGPSTIWDGELILNGTIENSMVTAKRFSSIGGNGKYNGGIILLPYSELIISDTKGGTDTLFVAGELVLNENTTMYFDLTDDPEGSTKKNDILILDGDLNLTSTTLDINRLNGKLSPGVYTLASISGSLNGKLEDIAIKGIPGVPYTLSFADNKLLLTVDATRAPGKVEWTGAVDDVWDVFNTLNWSNQGEEDYFIGEDSVEINDNALIRAVDVEGDFEVSDLNINVNSAFVIKGDGSLSGDAGLTKTGYGTLTILNDNTYTGSTRVEGGRIRMMTIKKAGEASAIGAATDAASKLVLDGGGLEILGSGDMVTDHKMTLGPKHGAISVVNPTATVSLANNLYGTGKLIKTGRGTLELTTANYMNGTYLQQGYLKLVGEEANINGLGDTVVLNGGVLAMSDDTYSYTTNCNWHIVVDEGKTGTLNLDSRCSLTGKLLGSGTLNLYTPWIRSHLDGNWSAFSGKINVSTDGDGGTLILNNDNGYPNAAIHIADEITIIREQTENATINIGELTGGSNAYLGAGGQGSNTITWRIGGLNTDFEFKGIINNAQFKNSGARAAIIKTGSGKMTLTGNNVYSGGTTVEKGTLIVNNTNGSGTGTGAVSVKSGAVLSGTGTISGSITINAGGYLVAGSGSSTSSTKALNTVRFNPDSYFAVSLNSDNGTADKLVCSSVAYLDGTIFVSTKGGAYKAGDSFKIIESNANLGNFKKVSPWSPGTGLAWDLSKMQSDGILAVTVGNTIEKTSIGAFDIFPNPGKGLFTLESDYMDEISHISVTNVEGKVIYTTSSIAKNKQVLDLQHLPTGIYMLNVETSHKTYNRRLIVQ